MWGISINNRSPQFNNKKVSHFNWCGGATSKAPSHHSFAPKYDLKTKKIVFFLHKCTL